MENKKMFEDMLEKLANDYPELEKEAMDLQSALFDLSEPDVAKGEEEMDMDMEEEMPEEEGGEVEIEIKAPEGKSPIPAELMDEEDMMPMPKKKK